MPFYDPNVPEQNEPEEKGSAIAIVIVACGSCLVLGFLTFAYLVLSGAF